MIKYDSESLALMSFFEKLTKSNLKDMFDMGEILVFVVEPFQLRKALGENAQNVQKLKERLKKKIKMVEYNADLATFIRSLIYPLRVNNFRFEEGIVTLEGEDTKTNGLLIGRGAANLRAYEVAVQRYFKDVKEIKVV